MFGVDATCKVVVVWIEVPYKCCHRILVSCNLMVTKG